MEENLSQKIDNLNKKFEQNINALTAKISNSNNITDLKNELKLIEYQKEFITIIKRVEDLGTENAELKKEISYLKENIKNQYTHFNDTLKLQENFYDNILTVIAIFAGILAFLFYSELNKYIKKLIDKMIKKGSEEELQKLTEKAEGYIKEIENIKCSIDEHSNQIEEQNRKIKQTTTIKNAHPVNKET